MRHCPRVGSIAITFVLAFTIVFHVEVSKSPMFGNVEDTPYDLKFSLFRIPVRVHPGFWIVTLIMGANLQRMDQIVAWIALCFVSILVHEFGHALVAKSYRWPVHVRLHWMGGTAHSSPYHGFTRNRSMWMSFAGPLAGFVLYGVVVAIEHGLVTAAMHNEKILQMLTGDSVLYWTIYQLKWVNLGWGLINLLPVYPLDGGQICFEYLNGSNSRRGRVKTHQIGMIVGGIAAFIFFQSGQTYSAVLFVSLALINFQNAEAIGR